MTTIELPPEMDLGKVLSRALDLFAKRLADAIFAEIQQRAHTSPILSQEDLNSYYRDEKMPFWRGTLLRSMRVEPSGDGGWRVLIGAQYASDIEEGNPREELVDGLLAEWAATHLRGRQEGNMMQVGAAHPFIKPAMEYVLENQLGALFAESLEDVINSPGAAPGAPV